MSAVLVPDHLVVCVPDLDESGANFLSRFGLASVSGGRHRGHGTANRIVPLGASYIELVAVVDQDEARGSVFGSWVTERSAGAAAVDALCLRTDQILRDSEILGATPVSMSRSKPDGSVLRWKVAGIDQAIEKGWPFLIEWMVAAEQMPGNTPLDHPIGEARLGQVVLSSHEPCALEADGVEFRNGDRGVTAAIVTSGGLVEI